MGFEWKRAGASLLGLDKDRSIVYASFDQLSNRPRLGEIYYQAFGRPGSDLAGMTDAIFVMAMTGSIIQAFLTVSPGPISRIYNVATAPEYRRKGLASNLIRSVLACPIPGVQNNYFWLNVTDAPNHPTLNLVRLYSNAHNSDGNFNAVARVQGGYHLDTSYQSIVMTFVRGIYQEPAASLDLVKWWREQNLFTHFTTSYQSIPALGQKRPVPRLTVPVGQIWSLDNEFRLLTQGTTVTLEHSLMRAISPVLSIQPTSWLLKLYWSTGTQLLQYDRLYSFTIVGYYWVRDIRERALQDQIIELVQRFANPTPLDIYKGLTGSWQRQMSHYLYNRVSSVPLFSITEPPAAMWVYS